jgi:hypothetical protein
MSTDAEQYAALLVSGFQGTPTANGNGTFSCVVHGFANYF